MLATCSMYKIQTSTKIYLLQSVICESMLLWFKQVKQQLNLDQGVLECTSWYSGFLQIRGRIIPLGLWWRWKKPQKIPLAFSNVAMKAAAEQWLLSGFLGGLYARFFPKESVNKCRNSLELGPASALTVQNRAQTRAKLFKALQLKV